MQSAHFVDVPNPATTAHVLNGCPVPLSQDHFTYQQNQVLHYLALELSDLIAIRLNTIHVYGDLVCKLVSLLRELFLHCLL